MGLYIGSMLVAAPYLIGIAVLIRDLGFVTVARILGISTAALASVMYGIFLIDAAVKVTVSP